MANGGPQLQKRREGATSAASHLVHPISQECGHTLAAAVFVYSRYGEAPSLLRERSRASHRTCANRRASKRTRKP